MHEVSHERCEPVVVAETDLVRRHRVVLVDDRDDPELEQPVEGATGVGVVAAPGHVVGGEEHLADGEPVGTEGVLVCRDEGSLPHAGGRLLGGEVTGAPPEVEGAEPGSDRPGRDEHDRVALLAAGGEDVDERHETGGVEATAGARQRRRAHLDDETSGGGDDGPGGHAVSLWSGRRTGVPVRMPTHADVSLGGGKGER